MKSSCLSADISGDYTSADCTYFHCCSHIQKKNCSIQGKLATPNGSGGNNSYHSWTSQRFKSYLQARKGNVLKPGLHHQTTHCSSSSTDFRVRPSAPGPKGRRLPGNLFSRSAKVQKYYLTYPVSIKTEQKPASQFPRSPCVLQMKWCTVLQLPSN